MRINIVYSLFLGTGQDKHIGKGFYLKDLKPLRMLGNGNNNDNNR